MKPNKLFKNEDMNDNSFYKEEGDFLGNGKAYDDPSNEVNTSYDNQYVNPYEGNVNNQQDLYQQMPIQEEKKSFPIKLVLIIVCGVIIISLIVFYFITNSSKLESVLITSDDVVYLDSSIDVSIKAVGKGNLDKTSYRISVDNSDVAFLDETTKVGSFTSFKLTGKSLGEFTLNISPSLKGKTINQQSKTIAVCNRLVEKEKNMTIIVNKDQNLDLDIGESSLCYKNLSYTNFDEEIVSVSEDGFVTGLKKGSTTVDVSDGVSLYKVNIEVIEEQEAVKPTNISLDKKTIKLNENEKATLNVTITPFNANDLSIIWKSDNENVAKVSNGVVLGISKGVAIITAETTNGLSSKVVVIVK